MLQPNKSKLSLKDKVKVAKSLIKQSLTPKSKKEKLESKKSRDAFEDYKTSIANEFKKGGLVKKQDGGIPGWQLKSRSVKNTEWQKAKVPSGPFSVVPPSDSISKPKPKPNWVSPPASKDTKKKGGATKNKNWIQDATASIKRRGTEGKCTPITKPGCTGKAKALAKTFKKIAKNR
jgi:hypothetical protein